MNHHTSTTPKPIPMPSNRPNQLSHPLAQGPPPYVPHTGDDVHGPSSHTAMGHFITTHVARKCNTCSMWTSHYMAAVSGRDETPEEAITQRDTAIRGSLTDELTTLQSTKDSVLRALDTMCNAFTREREELEDSHRSLRAAMANVERVHSAKGEIIDQANATIRELCDKN